MKTMRLPRVGDTVKEDGKVLKVNRVFTNRAGVKCVEYVDTNGLHGCVLPEYWYKKEETNSTGRLGSGAPS